ncbi:hypothetical protein Gotur_035598, partial [Gossypium turneri]
CQAFHNQLLLSKILEKVKRKWVLEEDATLVSCMVDLYNVETYNADTGFKVGYLNELERMLEKVLPYAMLKSKPNLESRIRTLKKDWVIVYDMLNGKDNSGLGWLYLTWIPSFFYRSIKQPLGNMLKQLQILLKK